MGAKVAVGGGRAGRYLACQIAVCTICAAVYLSYQVVCFVFGAFWMDWGSAAAADLIGCFFAGLFAVLAYDGTGCVASEGKFKGFDQGPVDVAAALRFAREHEALKGFRRVVLAGHSWGAFSVCNALDADERVAGAVAMCGFISSASVMGRQL